MSRRILSRRRRLCDVCCDRERVPPEGGSFFCQQKKEPKKIAAVSTQRTRDLGAARPQDPQRKSQRARATRTQYYCSRLTPAPSARFKIRSSPAPRRGRQRPLVKGLSPLGDWGFRRAMRCNPFPGNRPPTAKGRAAAPSPLSSATHSRYLAIATPLSFAS